MQLTAANLCHQPLQSWRNGHINDSSVEAAFPWPQQSGIPVTKACLSVVFAKYPVCQQQRTILIWHHYWTSSVASSRQVAFIGLFSCWKGELFILTCLIEMDMCSGYGFAFPVDLVSASMTVRFVECLICWHGILRNIASDIGTCFTTKGVHEWP